MIGKLIKKEGHVEMWQHHVGYDVINNVPIETYTDTYGIKTSIYPGIRFNQFAPGAAQTAFAELLKGSDLGRLTILENLNQNP